MPCFVKDFGICGAVRMRGPRMSLMTGEAYAGDIPPAEAWRLLSDSGPAQLVDVRTRPEWSFVGLPELSGLGKAPLLIEWQVYPEMAVDDAFVDRLSAALDGAGASREDPVLFLCRSGVRSRSAAIAATAAGWQRCLNVAGGFEGPLDPNGHRGQRDGWKAAGLPWKQT